MVVVGGNEGDVVVVGGNERVMRWWEGMRG